MSKKLLASVFRVYHQILARPPLILTRAATSIAAIRAADLAVASNYVYKCNNNFVLSCWYYDTVTKFEKQGVLWRRAFWTYFGKVCETGRS